MRWLPEQLPFSSRVLLAFAVPLLVWVLASAASIFALHLAGSSQDDYSRSQQIILLGNEYLHTIERIGREERLLLATGDEDARLRHRHTIRDANEIHARLQRLTRDDEDQSERLERAGERLQEWFYEVSNRRVRARQQLPDEQVRNAQVVQHGLARLLLADADNDEPVITNTAQMRDAIESLRGLRHPRIDRNIFERALSFFRQLELEAQANAPPDSESLREIAGELLPAIWIILDEDNAIRDALSGDDANQLAVDFEQSTNALIEAEERRLREHRARADLTANAARWIIWIGLLLGVISMVFVTIWFARRLARSVESINEAAEQIAEGNFSARAEPEESEGTLAARFNLMAALIDQRHRQSNLLAELGETLHNCRSVSEALKVFGDFTGKLFPGNSGVLYLMEPNQMDVTAVSSWHDGISHSEEHMARDACWGLRLGRMHENGAQGATLCDHLKEPVQDSLCVPLPAFGQIIGMLYITLDPNYLEVPERTRERQFVHTVAEQVALALANVRLRDELRNQSIRDPLTKLYNRRHLDEVLERELHRAKRHEEPLAVFTFDIDRFKDFNDQHGHDGGDAVLKGIAELVRDLFRAEDRAFRIGGEEFVILLPETSRDGAITRAEELREKISRMKVLLGNTHLPPVTISVGVATFPESGGTAERLLKAADIALYEAKDAGRNCVIADPGQ